MTSRRKFLVGASFAGIGAAATAIIPFPIGVGGATAANSVAAPNSLSDAPDAGGFTRPYGAKCVCLPPQEWMNNGDWVMQRTLELLQPDHWHSWGDWPENGYPGRIPMVFASRYFDHERVLRRMQANSGEFWANVNEPEMPEQCFEPAEAIADLTCQLIDIGQHSGSTWQWGSPAVTLTTEHNGLAWLTRWVEIMRQKKGIAKPFTWFIHPYTCNSVSKLHESMDAWWEWYHKDNKGQGAPVVIHEVCAEDAGPDVQADVMFECHKMLRSGDVNGVFWFATYRSSVEEQRRQKRIPWQYYPLCVLDHSTQSVSLTPLGRYWKELQ